MWILIVVTVFGSGSVMANQVKEFATPDLCHQAKAALYQGTPEYTQVYLCLTPKGDLTSNTPGGRHE